MPSRILMLGTSLDTMGGVASVLQIYRSRGLFARWPVTYVTTHVDGSGARKLLQAAKAWCHFTASLVRDDSDFVLHVHCASRASFWRKSAFVLPAAWTGAAVILHLHGAEFMQFYHNETGPLVKRLIRYVFDKCDRVIVLSESWRAAVAEITTSRIDVIANPSLPLHPDSAPGERDAETLLFLGRLGRRKGIHVLLEAVVQVRKEYPAVRLLCGGDGDLEEVRNAARRLGVAEHVEFLGWVDEARRSALLASATVYVLPSFAEGLPMSILEALSAGLPVVTTPVGGIPDAIADGEEGLLVPPGDPEALAAAICRLLGNPTLRQAMGRRARAKFDTCYDASVALPRLESVYRELGVRPVGSG